MGSAVPQFKTGPSATYSSTSNQSAAWVAQTIVLDWVQTSSGSNPNQTTLTLTKPTNATAGDVLLAGLAYAGNVTISTVPAGWTLIQRRVNTNAAAPVTHVTYWKVATASEPASYTWTASSNVRSVGGITAYANIDPNSPIDAFASTPASDGTQAASATLTAPSLTTTAANDVVVVLFAITGNNSITTGPSGMLNRYDTQAGQTSVATSAFDALQAAAGSSGANN